MLYDGQRMVQTKRTMEDLRKEKCPLNSFLAVCRAPRITSHTI